MHVTFNDLFSSMAALSIHHSSYTGRMTLTADLLDIEVTDEVQAVLRFGSLRLLPDDAFSTINATVAAARELLKKNSLQFAMVPGARLVRLDKLQDVLNGLKACRAAHDAAREQFREKYNGWRDAQLPVIQTALQTAMKVDLNNPFDPNTLKKLEILEKVMVVIQASYPTADEAAAKFALRWTTPFSIDKSKSSSLTAEDVQAELDDLKGVLQGVIEELRTDFTARVKDLRELVARGGKVTKKTTNSVREALTRIRELNIVNDTVLLEQINAVELWLNRLDSDVAGTVNGGLVVGLDEIVATVQADMDSAVDAAASTLVNLGKRKLTLPGTSPVPA